MFGVAWKGEILIVDIGPLGFWRWPKEAPFK